MASTIEELSVDFTDEEGKLLVKQLDKEVLTKGTWTTIMFKYQEMDKNSGEYKAPKFSIRRYQKRNGEYNVKSKFVISSPAQGEKVVTILTKWIAESGGVSASDGGDSDE